jgi:DUF2950 family protein
MSRAVSNHGWLVIPLAAILAIAAGSCGKSRNVTGTGAQKLFASPEDAGLALFTAANTGDQQQVVEIFGPNSTTVLFTGDPTVDRARLNHFANAYKQMHRWRGIEAGGQVLIVGIDNIVFPVPLGKNSSGKWYFDTAAGRDETLARRIGKNELTAMDGTKALAQAEREYHEAPRGGDKVKQYAQKFVSDPGKQNGLYWPVADGYVRSPLGQLDDFGKLQSSANAGSDAEFNGYRYRILTKGQTGSGVKDYVVDGKMTGGFAILASPVEYRNSGITSFLIGPDGLLYQKDLGVNTARLASLLSDYNPSDGWKPISSNPATSASRAQQ